MPPDLPVPTVRRGDVPGHGDLPGREESIPERQGSLVRLVPDVGRCSRLRVFNLSLACCAVEYLAAATEPRRSQAGVRPRTGFEELGAEAFAPGPDCADVLVVSGTVTEAMAPVVRAAYDALREPRYVVSFGACSNTGGPYWDSYSVVTGVDRIVPVDVYVAGCPPRPDALLDALTSLPERRVGGAPR